MWKDYYEPQITARNRWAVQGTVRGGADGPAPRPLRRPRSTAARRAALVTVVAGGLAAAVVAVVGPTSGSPATAARTEVVAPAPEAPPVTGIPAQHQVGPGRALAE